MASQVGTIYNVNLSSTHKDYQQAGFRRPPGYNNYYFVVEVDMVKFIHYCEGSPNPKMASPVQDWNAEKKEGLKTFLSPPVNGQLHPEMPVVSFNIRVSIKSERRFWFFRKKTEVTETYVAFTDGRHRTRYLQFAGAKKMWVLCHSSYVNDLKKYCGV